MWRVKKEKEELVDTTKRCFSLPWLIVVVVGGGGGADLASIAHRAPI